MKKLKTISNIDELEKVIKESPSWVKHYYERVKYSHSHTEKLENLYKLMRWLHTKGYVICKDLIRELLW